MSRVIEALERAAEVVSISALEAERIEGAGGVIPQKCRADAAALRELAAALKNVTDTAALDDALNHMPWEWLDVKRPDVHAAMDRLAALLTEASGPGVSGHE